MNDKMSCREVKRIILSVSDDEGVRPSRSVSKHLSECQDCKSLYAASEKVDRVFAEEQLRLVTLASQSQTGKHGVFAEISSPPPRRALWCLRPLWTGAAAILLAIAGASAFYLLKGRGDKGPDNVGTPMTTWSMAAAASSETVRELAEVVRRHEAPSPELPYTPPARDSFVPGLLQRTVMESEDTLSMILGSRTRLTRREET